MWWQSKRRMILLEGGLDVDVVTDVCELSGVFGEQLSRRRKFRRVRHRAQHRRSMGLRPESSADRVFDEVGCSLCCMVTRQQTAPSESIE